MYLFYVKNVFFMVEMSRVVMFFVRRFDVWMKIIINIIKVIRGINLVFEKKNIVYVNINFYVYYLFMYDDNNYKLWEFCNIMIIINFLKLELKLLLCYLRFICIFNTC